MCQVCENDFEVDDIIFLDCSGCKRIMSLPSRLPNLKFLAIYDTNIGSVPSYPKLETLYCFNTPLIEIPYLPKLRKLFAQSSSILEIPKTLYCLEILNIDDTNIEEIPDSLIELRVLSAKRSKLKSISSKLLSLEILNIKNTNVEEMPDSMMSLQYLNISNTKIIIDHAKYKMLRTLACVGCGVDPFSIGNGVDVLM